jgi:hypothetical protein
MDYRSAHRVASRHLAASDPFGPRVPVTVRDRVLKYRVKANDRGILVAVYDGPKRVAAMDAYTAGNLYDLKCSKDAFALLERHPELEDTSRPRWVAWGRAIPRVQTLAVSHADVFDEGRRGQGIGRAMYQALMSEWFDRVGPFLFMPDECGTVGSTSSAANRVWASLASRFPSSGSVVAVLTRPT